MSASNHSDIGPELRQLVQAILDRLDPAVRGAAAVAADSLRGPASCQQVWCPVCALAALVSGEQHPMLTVISEHSVALMTILRTMVADTQAGPAAEEAAQTPDVQTPDGQAPDAEAPRRNGNGRYQSIPIVIEPGDEG